MPGVKIAESDLEGECFIDLLLDSLFIKVI